MNVVELKKEELNLHLSVVIPASVIDSEIKKELASISKTAKLPGFRPGKVPLPVIQQKYGDSVRVNALQNQVRQSITNIIKDRDLDVIGEPKIEELKSEPDQDLQFVVKFELIPQIKIPDLKQISLEKPVLKVEDKDTEQQINRLLEIATKYEESPKRKTKNKDQVIIDAVGTVDGEEFAGGKLENYKLVIGSGVFIPGFEDQLIGVKASDDVTVSVTFPGDYHAKELAGKPAEFKVKVVSVLTPETPELNDEFVQQYGSKTVAEFKEKMKELVASQYKASINSVMKLDLFNQLEKLLNFDAPSSLVQNELGVLRANHEEAKKSGESLPDKSDAELEEYYKNLALRRVKIGLMLAEYAKLNNLQVTMDEIKQAVMAQARNFPGQEKLIFDYYTKNPSALSSLRGPILEDKAVQHIFDNQVNLSEKQYSKEALEKFLDKEATKYS